MKACFQHINTFTKLCFNKTPHFLIVYSLSTFDLNVKNWSCVSFCWSYFKSVRQNGHFFCICPLNNCCFKSCCSWDSFNQKINLYYIIIYIYIYIYIYIHTHTCFSPMLFFKFHMNIVCCTNSIYLTKEFQWNVLQWFSASWIQFM